MNTPGNSDLNSDGNKGTTTLEIFGHKLEQAGSHPLAQKWSKISQFNQKAVGLSWITLQINKVACMIFETIQRKLNIQVSQKNKELIQAFESHKYYILGIAYTDKALLTNIISNIFGPKMFFDALYRRELFTGTEIPLKSTYRTNYFISGGLSSINLLLLADLINETRNKGSEHFDSKDYAIVMYMICSRIIIHITYAIAMGHFLSNYNIQGESILQKAKRFALKHELRNINSSDNPDSPLPPHDTEV